MLSFGLGGYLAGRLRAPGATVASATVADTVVEETERANGVHGLGAWALAVVMGAILATLLGAATVSRTSPARSGSQTSAAEPLLSYELEHPSVKLKRIRRDGDSFGIAEARSRDDDAYSAPEFIDGAFCSLSQSCLELGEGQLDRI